MAEAVAAGLVTSSADSIEAVVMSNNGDIGRLQRVEKRTAYKRRKIGAKKLTIRMLLF